MKVKWYDIVGLVVPIYLTMWWVIVYVVASMNNWNVLLMANNYGEGLIELVLISIAFIWGFISVIRIMKVCITK